MTNENTKLPDVLMTMPIPTSAGSFDTRFTVHRLWQASNPEKLITEIGNRIRAVAAGGHSLVDHTLLDQLPNLELIANFGVGYEHVDLELARHRNVIVTNTPDVLTEEVADLALGLLLSTVRRIPQADSFFRAGHWIKGAFPLSPSLRNRTIGILGLGRIGNAIAKRCAAFNVPVVYHSRTKQRDAPYEYYSSVLELATACDVLMIVIPGGNTPPVVNAEVLEALGPEGILINVGRGSAVDEAALITALRENRILAAGLDVFTSEPTASRELASLENAVLLPHVGSATNDTRSAMGQMVLDNLISWFDGEGPLTPVPETPWKAR